MTQNTTRQPALFDNHSAKKTRRNYLQIGAELNMHRETARRVCLRAGLDRDEAKKVRRSLYLEGDIEWRKYDPIAR